ncbi:MAG: SDR family NAD(P)-dependent oxidoreductase [Candidatus Electrothrix sp. AX1]|nr:SDR family NAD(P)-dependent oxidoreductase [Candidatus Electrothrix sp. AX1]
MKSRSIAIIGMACHYPGAQDLRSFWENILTRRRQFRSFPDSRLPLADYYNPDPAAPDKTYCCKAGLIDGFSFDPAHYRIPKTTFESTDIVHWLALQVALASLQDAGLDKESMPKERTGVILGNSLTGEHSRAEGLRLRWPFVRRVVQTAAHERGLSSEQITELLRVTEGYYTSVFTPMTEDTLAGSLSNTIAGRICNSLDLHGGGYTVDGACSSSVIAAATAANHLVNQELDLALAGGVDISLDTFELVGFAKTAALTTNDMRVYDRRANGFIPGEGCGIVVMKRLQDAVRDGDYVYAVLHGWGISSDGKGSLTAPNAQGQARALQRAYERAGWDMQKLDFIEGHGTGTAIGDRTELEGIVLAMQHTTKYYAKNHRENNTEQRQRAKDAEQLRPCGMTSLKSLIGHTKAASGAGALIKTVIALNQRVLPPLANCFDPNPVFADKASALYPLIHGEVRSSQETLRAGVSGMGFGGINSHLALASGDAPSAKLRSALSEQKLLADYQRTELFIFSAPDIGELIKRVEAAEKLAGNICEGERLDLAAHLSKLYGYDPGGHDPSSNLVRAAVIAESPEMLLQALAEIMYVLRTKPPKEGQTFVDFQSGLCIGNNVQRHRVGFLFPGQGSQQINMGCQLVQRHDWAAKMVQTMEQALAWPAGQQLHDLIFRPVERALNTAQVHDWQEQLKQTEVAQPAICLASLLRLEQLTRLGVTPAAVGGHSLGELTACYAAGAYSGEELLRFAALRGQAMAASSSEQAGTMASLVCSAEKAQVLLHAVLGSQSTGKAEKGYAVVANKNSPSQTVLSGQPSSMKEICRFARNQGIRATPLPVANAFHSRFVSQAAQVLAKSCLLPDKPRQLTTALFSGLQGGRITLDCNLKKHFAEQVTSPVDFITLVQEISRECDLLLEVGPGRVLTGLAQSILADRDREAPLCFAVETTPEQDRDLNIFLANYFVRGGTVHWHVLYEDRLVRPFTPSHERVFLTNPCERPLRSFEGQTEQGSGKKNLGVTDRLLAKYAGISEEDLASYLEQRGGFLGGLIRLDIDNMSSLGSRLSAPDQAAHKPSFSSFLPKITEKFAAKKAHQPASPENQVEQEKQSSTELLFSLIEERTGFSRKSLSLDLRLLDDLNLDSIKASELIAEAANRTGVRAATLHVAEYANATLQEVAALLDKEAGREQEQGQRQGGGQQHHKEAGQVGEHTESTTGYSSKYPGWVRDFTLQYFPEPLNQSYNKTITYDQQEEVLLLVEPSEQYLAEPLILALQQDSEVHVKVQQVSFAEASQAEVSLLDRFTSVIALLPELPQKLLHQHILVEQVAKLHTIFSPCFYRTGSDDQDQALVVVQIGDGFFHDGAVVGLTKNNITISKVTTKDITAWQYSVKALAASYHLEQPDRKVRVLHFSSQIPVAKLCEYILRELSTPENYAAVSYAADQIRRVPRPVVRNTATDTLRTILWSPKDVILATGGAKGITAECALAFARATGVQLALVGNSSPSISNKQHDAILQTLKRADMGGLSAQYYQCDITDGEAVKRLVRQVEHEQGAITGVIHGSALNRPAELCHVSVDQALQEIGPKILGAINICAALQDHPPRLFVGFSSLIGITGMQKNGWYGFSNEALYFFLQQYRKAQPRTAILSIAFSIWDEVGMGVRMGSTSWLRTQGVESLSVAQGVSRFLQLTTYNPGTDQVIVTARTAGLDTFVPYGPELPQGLRFIDRVHTFQPGIEIFSQTRLSLEDDPYIKDHCWQGTYLFPMVFGLEAMAQAVQAVTGVTCFAAICIREIELARPIIVAEKTGAEIEIHALVLEQSGDEQCIQVQIRTEQTDCRVDHFSAVFVFQDYQDEQEENPSHPSSQQEVPSQLNQLMPLDLVPEVDLYKEGFLFQGPLYQKIAQVFELNSTSCLFSVSPLGVSDQKKEIEEIEEIEQEWLLGNPFFRDTLLQSGQLPIPRDLCLPRRIEQIKRFPVKNQGSQSGSQANCQNKRQVWGKVIIEEHREGYVYSSVTMFDATGQVIEQITGYKARIVEHNKDNPTAEELACPDQRDRMILLNELEKRKGLLPMHCMLPQLNVAFLPCLQYMSKKERRKKELPFIKSSLAPLLDGSDLRIEISWSEQGKPFLAIPTDAGVNFSLTHNEGTLVCSAGPGVQGCDLETVVDRSLESWHDLLGLDEGNKAILANLLQQGDSLQRAGTRLWTVFECIFKALERRPVVHFLRLLEKKDNTVLFIYDDCCLLTFPVQLTLREERMLAVVVPKKVGQNFSAQQVPVSTVPSEDNNIKNINKVWPKKVGSFTHEFTTTFLEGRGAAGKVYFTNIPIWMGELRELALLPIADSLVQDMKSRQWGMVTNRSSFTVDRQLDSYDTVIGEVRLLEDTDLSNSFLSLGFKWFKKQTDGSLMQAISGNLATTWVKVQGHGKVKQNNLPEYFIAYLKKLSCSQDYAKPQKKKPHAFFFKASSLFMATVSTRKQNILLKQQFLTSHEDSNLVGNIYFSNYYAWQARVRDQYLASSFPTLCSKSCSGDFVCVHAEVHHLQEAMPFEIIEVSMYLYELFAEGFTLYFEYHSVGKHGTRLKKLAHGEHTAVWVPKGPEVHSNTSLLQMPNEYVEHFMQKVGKTTDKV